MRHLTEEEIQAYLDGSPDERDAELRHHLDTCKQCREVLGHYRALYADLADGAALNIPKGLAGTVTSRLGLRPTRHRLTAPGDLVLVTCGILAMLIAVSVFVDLRPLLDTISAATSHLFQQTSPGLESTHNRLMNAGHILTIPATGIAVLVTMWALDRLFERRRPLVARRGR